MQLLIPQVWGFSSTRPASKLPLQTPVTNPGVSDWPATDLRFQQLLLRFNEFARAAHRTETFYLLGNQVINIKEEEFNSQMKKSTASFHTVSRLIALLASPRVPTWKLPRPCSFKGFVVTSLHRHGWLNHWPLVMDSISFLPSPEIKRWEVTSQPSLTVLVPLATSSFPTLWRPRGGPRATSLA